MSETEVTRKSLTAIATCQQCGQVLNDAGEFHPYLFCVLKKAGRTDPWEDIRWVIEQLNLSHGLPSKPPLVADLTRERLGRIRSVSNG